MDALRNEQLPLRTLVQVLFTEQERTTRINSPEPRHGKVVMEPPSKAAHNKEIEESPAEPRHMRKEITTESDATQLRPMSRIPGKQVMEVEKGKWIQKKKD